MTEYLYDLRTVPLDGGARQALEDHFATSHSSQITATEAYSQDAAFGSDPLGWADWSGGGPDRAVLTADGLTMPDGDYRVHLLYEMTAANEYRSGPGALCRVQADRSCYGAYRKNNTDGIVIFHSSGSQYAVITALGTELAEMGSVSSTHGVPGLDIGVSAETIDANTVRIYAYNLRSGAFLFSVDDTSGTRIESAGHPGWGSIGSATPTMHMFEFYVNDGASAQNLGLRIDTIEQDGSDYPDLSNVVTELYYPDHQTHFLTKTANIASVQLVIDDPVFDALAVGNQMLGVHKDSNGAVISASIYSVVDLNVPSTTSDGD